MKPDKKEPGAYVRFHHHDFKVAKRIAKQRGMPLTIWLRVISMERIEAELEKERTDGK